MFSFGYNTCIQWGGLLREAIESVLNQPYLNIELICVNDGSTDDSQDIIDDVCKKDERVVVYKQNNKGVASARNRGLKMAHGEYVTFLDQDDVYVRDSITNSIAEYIKEESPDLVSFGLYCSNNKITRVREEPRESKIIYVPSEDIIGENWRHHSSYFFKKSFLIEKEIITQHYRNEDVRFLHQAVLLAEKIVYCSEKLFVYRENYKSVTHSDNNYTEVLVSCLKGYVELEKNTQYSIIKEYSQNCVPRLFMELLYFVSGEMQDTFEECEKYRKLFMIDDRIEKGAYMNENVCDSWKSYNDNPKAFIENNRKCYKKTKIFHRIGKHFPIIRYFYNFKKYPVKIHV